MATLLENKKIRLDYEIMESYEAGIELLGLEVKSLRAHLGSLAGSYIIVRGGEAFLVGSHIPAYQEKNAPADFDPYRNRRLLLRKNEIAELSNIKKGLTAVPISMYSKHTRKTAPAQKNANAAKKGVVFSDGTIKIEVAVVRGKKKYDKRETLKKRDTEREISREYGL